jgi:hypothetical protein
LLQLLVDIPLMLLTYALSTTTRAKDRKQLAAILDALQAGLEQARAQSHDSATHSPLLENAASEFFCYVKVHRNTKTPRTTEISRELEDILTRRLPAAARSERISALMVKVRAEANRLA